MKEAQVLFQKLYHHDDSSTIALLGLGSLAIAHKDYPKALSYYERALRVTEDSSTLLMEPEYFPYLKDLGALYRRTENYSKAEEIFLLLQKLRPNHEESYLQLGLLYKELGAFDEAMAMHDSGFTGAFAGNCSTFVLHRTTESASTHGRS